MPSPPRRARYRERAAHLLEGLLRYLAARPAQLLLASLLLVCAGAGLAAPFAPGGPPHASATPTLASVIPAPVIPAPAIPTVPGALTSPGEPATASPPVAPEPATPPTTPAARTIRINRGDTLWALARRYDTTVHQLQQLNGLGSSTLIRAGRTLRLPARPPS